MKKTNKQLNLLINCTENLCNILIVIDKSEFESQCNIFTKEIDESKNETFL